MSNNYQDFINQCWSNHAKKPEEVANQLKENLALIDSSERIPGYVSVTIHTLGGHLGKWEEAKELLHKITKLSCFDHNQAVYRGLATLNYCMDNEAEFNKYLELSTEESSSSRIYAIAASELAEQGQIKKAIEAFKRALALAPKNMEKESPAARALAITGNNLACELEERQESNPEETELMLLAAQTGRKYWEVAGTWIEVERAEYRLSMSYLKAGKLEEALKHARLCESICKENEADSFESFFAYEALTKVNRAICKNLKSQVKEDYRSYCIIP